VFTAMPDGIELHGGAELAKRQGDWLAKGAAWNGREVRFLANRMGLGPSDNSLGSVVGLAKRP
jgi:hypothetical protein